MRKIRGKPARRGSQVAGTLLRHRKIVAGSGIGRGLDRHKWYLCRAERREKGAGEPIAPMFRCGN
ncbi:hypothetical protein BC2230_10787 [Burkholderia cepacia]